VDWYGLSLCSRNNQLEKSGLLISFGVLIDCDIPWLDRIFAKINCNNSAKQEQVVENIEWIEISQQLKYFIFPKDEISS
jgi:hypothetical protein